ncbi:MAG: GTP 3',8-cyclase MoaA [Thermodesulfovibrionales bacterium]
MKDSFGRKIDYLRLSVTDRCNLRCIYCMPKGFPACARPHEALDPGLIRRTLAVCKRHGLRKVRFTGGEPLLRADIAGLVESARALGIEDISLTTNGLLLGRLARGLKRAGLGRVNVSLDTLVPERYAFITGGGKIRDALDGIDEAERAGLGPVKINMIPIRGINDDEVVSFARLTLSRPVHVRFIELMPVGEGAWSGRRRVECAEAARRITSALGGLAPLGEAGSSRNYRLEGAKGVLGFISPMSRHFCGSCNRLRVTARGTLRPCLFSKNEIDLRAAGSEEELEALLLSGVRGKPRGRPDGAPLPLEAMSQIGG